MKFKFKIGDIVEIIRYDMTETKGEVRLVHDGLWDHDCLVMVNSEPYISIWVHKNNLKLIERISKKCEACGQTKEQ